MHANASNWMENPIQRDCPFFQKQFFWENFYDFLEKFSWEIIFYFGKIFPSLGTFLIYAFLI
jgi:hypothetical protein